MNYKVYKSYSHYLSFAIRAVNNAYIFSVLCLSHIITSIRRHFCALEPLTSNLPWHIFSYYCLDFYYSQLLVLHSFDWSVIVPNLILETLWITYVSSRMWIEVLGFGTNTWSNDSWQCKHDPQVVIHPFLSQPFSAVQSCSCSFKHSCFIAHLLALYHCHAVFIHTFYFTKGVKGGQMC